MYQIFLKQDGKPQIALPVRLIPFATDWLLDPPTIARLCAGTEPRVPGGSDRIILPSHFLQAPNVFQSMPVRAWDEVHRGLLSLEQKLKAEEPVEGANLQEWRKQSILMLPDSVFVWRKDLEAAWRVLYPRKPVIENDEFDADRKTEYPLYEGRPGDYALVLQPWIPEDMRVVVLQGFGAENQGPPTHNPALSHETLAQDPKWRFPHAVGQTITVKDLLDKRWNSTLEFLKILAKQKMLVPALNGIHAFVSVENSGLSKKIWFDFISKERDTERFNSIPVEAYYFLPEVLAYEETNPNVLRNSKDVGRPADSEHANTGAFEDSASESSVTEYPLRQEERKLETKERNKQLQQDMDVLAAKHERNGKQWNKKWLAFELSKCSKWSDMNPYRIERVTKKPKLKKS